jgi:cellulose synthase/poly-beta-1,6-N-acetylglucosamine synthase-like glycosyltransferase
VYREIHDALVALSFLYFVVINLQYTIFLILSFFGSRERVRQSEMTDFDIVAGSRLTPPISILIPAYNEEKVIVNSVSVALDLTYPEYEVIVINDGSKDRTMRRLEDVFDCERIDTTYRATIVTERVRRIMRSRKDPRLIVVDKENGGKADSLNAGINVARYRYICNTDADTIFEKDALLRIIRPVLEDPRRLVAIGGQVRVGNGFRIEGGKIVERRLPLTLLPTLQVVEYLRTFVGNRVGWSLINAMILISGAFGLWRRDVLVSAGGFSRRTTGEDLELTMRLHRILRRRKEDFRIVSLPDPVCWTEAPTDIASFTRQRNRWHRVMLESFTEHREMMLNPRFGAVGLLAMPYLFFFEIFGPFLEAASYAVMLWTFIGDPSSGQLFAAFLVLSVGYTAILNMAAILIEEFHYGTYNLREVAWLMFIGLLDSLGYRQFTMAIRIWATFDWFGRIKSWGRIERRGF